MPKALRAVRDRVRAASLDRVWIFPPFIRGRRESGLVTMSIRQDGGPDRLLTLSYAAEETGKGVSFDCTLSEEGAAPRDRFQRLMDGVVRRSGEGHAEPRVVEIDGSHDTLMGLIAEFETPEEVVDS